MDLNKLIETFKTYYNREGLDRWVGDNQLIAHPSADVWNEMIANNSTVLSEIHKLNSSTSLAINYHEMLAAERRVKVKYEVPTAVPLFAYRGRSAVIDARYTWKDTTYYVESKFLEPYYSSTHPVREAYFEENHYKDATIAKKWIEMFNSVKDEFEYYDINQMLKHLLALYRLQPSGKIVLQNLIWKPTDSFFSVMKSKRSVSYLKKRVCVLQVEMRKADQMLSAFLEKGLNWNDCTIEICFYNDVLNQVSTDMHFQEFKEKYLFE